MGYYCRFTFQFATIAAPVTKLLKKNGFHWSEEAKVAFGKLKKAMTSTPILRLPDFTLPFVIKPDASDAGVGAILM